MKPSNPLAEAMTTPIVVFVLGYILGFIMGGAIK